MTSPTPPLEVLIIGAGTTGLLLAQGLKQSGLKVTIFERELPGASRKYNREWSMSLHWGSEAISKILPSELYSRMNEAFVDSNWNAKDGWTLNQYDGSTGELVMETPMPPGAARVSRTKMRKLFSEGLDVRYGKKLVSISQDENGVTAVFEDGSQATGSVLIGCDGGRSVARRLLVGEEKAASKDLGISVMNFPLHFKPDLAKQIHAQHPIAFNTYHPKNWMFWVSTVDVPNPEDPESWLIQLMFFWRPGDEDLADQASRTAFLRSKSEEYVEPWRSILSAIPDDASFGIDHIHEWQPFDWSSSPLADRVTLAGDAAHNMAPNRGQGLNIGLQDAAVLSELLSKAEPTPESLCAALRKYEAEMLPRSSREVQISSKAASLAHNFEMLKESPLARFGIRKSRNDDL